MLSVFNALGLRPCQLSSKSDRRMGRPRNKPQRSQGAFLGDPRAARKGSTAGGGEHTKHGGEILSKTARNYVSLTGLKLTQAWRVSELFSNKAISPHLLKRIN